MAKKRDSNYYRERLRREHPAVFKDLQAGRIPSVRRAAAQAGLIRLPGRLDALKREWRKANDGDRQEFAEWVREQLSSSVVVPAEVVDDLPPFQEPEPERPKDEPLVDGSGLLLPDIVGRVETILSARKIRPSALMVPALRREWRPNPGFLTRLKAWIAENEHR